MREYNGESLYSLDRYCGPAKIVMVGDQDLAMHTASAVPMHAPATRSTNSIRVKPSPPTAACGEPGRARLPGAGSLLPFVRQAEPHLRAGDDLGPRLRSSERNVDGAFELLAVAALFQTGIDDDEESAVAAAADLRCSRF